MKYKIIKNSNNQNEIHSELASKIWPEFMYHDIISNKYWKYLFTNFLSFQVAYVLGKTTIGIVNSVPLRWDKDFNELPDEGFDWAFKKAINDYNNNVKPNLLVVLQISVNKDYQGQGLSTLLLKSMKEISKQNDFKHTAIPIRPTLKSDYPLISINDYITWKRVDNLPFDPWLRIHMRNGCKILRVCKKSMKIEGTVQEWESWTNKKYPGNGDYIVAGALTPISIDTKKNIGEYIESNVWILYNT